MANEGGSPCRFRSGPGNSNLDFYRVPNDAPLFDRNNHRVRTRERLDARLRKPGLAHPGLAVGPGKVETARRLDQHVQAHQQTECVLVPLVIDNRLVYNERSALGERGIGLFPATCASAKDPSRVEYGP
jgi:hypothetical protein